MTFKQNWEKTNQHMEIAPKAIEGMVRLAFPSARLSSYEIIAGGCANLNVKITLESKAQPYILRVYVRDKEAPYIEQKLGVLLQGIVPIPQIYFIGDLEDHRFAIAEFMPGITLRDYLLNGEAQAMESLMREAGEILAKLQTIQFPSSGFFNRDLSIQESHTLPSCVSFAKDCLNHPTVKETLGQVTISQIHKILEDCSDLFPDDGDSHLVHGDFDPANVLVHQINGRWHISGLLDWEFAFSGSHLWDVANMLRYAHQMPPLYEYSFLKGIEHGGITLPPDWRRRISLLNILSLLDCLARSSPVHHPHRCADIRGLIAYFINQVGGNQ